MQHTEDPRVLTAMENRHEHGTILVELRNIREDLKELMNVTRLENERQHREVNSTIKELREEIQNQRIKLTEVSSSVEGSKKAIYMVAAPALFVAISAMAKSMGFI